MNLRTWTVLAALAAILAGCTSAEPPADEPNGESMPDGGVSEHVTPPGSPADPEPVAPADDEDGSAQPERSGDLDVSVCWVAEPVGTGGSVGLVDHTRESALVAPLTGMLGHAFATGDVTGDGWLDVFVGTFADRPEEVYRVRGATGPSPDRLLIGGPDGFEVEEAFPEIRERTSGATFADLTLDGRLELIAARNPRGEGRGAGATTIYRHDRQRLVEAATLVPDTAVRAIAVLDLDDDGLLDLFMVADRWGGGSTKLLRNDGDLSFTDVTADSGLPTEDLQGLGAGAADLTGNGHTDLFVAGDNRLFVNNGDGTFREGDTEVFQWETYGNEDEVAGIAIADLTRNGRPDLVLGHHFNSTVDHGSRVPIRVYLNAGVDDRGDPIFRDVTEQAGLPPLATKAPHVEVVDVDNDGWPDIVTSASTADGTQPAIFRHEGVIDGIPRFSTAEGLGDEQYWVTGGAVDLTQDGRVEIVLIEWFPELPSRLWRVDGPVGSWLQVQVPPHAFGAQVEAYEAGGLGDPTRLIVAREVIASIGYAAGGPPLVHLGLGERDQVDLRIALPDGSTADLAGVATNRFLSAGGGCP